MSQASIEHISIDESGIARLVGRQTKVTEIVMDKLAWDWTPEQIQAQHPHLSLAEIHAALTYYYDHREEIDEQIRRYHEEVESIRARFGSTGLADSLRSRAGQP